jgi:hypothetical protein
VVELGNLAARRICGFEDAFWPRLDAIHASCLHHLSDLYRTTGREADVNTFCVTVCRQPGAPALHEVLAALVRRRKREALASWKRRAAPESRAVPMSTRWRSPMPERGEAIRLPEDRRAACRRYP